MRNVQRYGWLLLYLFGASPAVCKSFLRGQQAVALTEFDANTWYEPYATSLRMSDIGYTNKRRCALKVSYDDLNAFSASLINALHTPCPPYQAIGVEVDGEYRQLSANVLQIEDEYYSIVRPKQIPAAGQRPLAALRERGVRYVELRSSDIDVFEPAGVGPHQLRFQEAFLIFCLLADSPPISADEQNRIDYNLLMTAREGRDPALRLWGGSGDHGLADWGRSICEALEGICDVLDSARSDGAYSAALAHQRAALDNPERTLSARVLEAMRADRLGFYHFAKAQSERFQQLFRNSPLSRERHEELAALVQRSGERQAHLERNDRESFSAFLQAYLAQL